MGDQEVDNMVDEITESEDSDGISTFESLEDKKMTTLQRPLSQKE